MRLPLIGPRVKSAHAHWQQRRFAETWDEVNAAARRAFEAESPRLGDEQRRVLAEVRERGYGFAHFDELFGDPALWAALTADVEGWLASEEVRRQGRVYREGGDLGTKKKEYNITRFDKGTVVGWDNPWLAVGTRPELLDLVNGFYGLAAKMLYFDVWNTVAPPERRPPIASQRWHRDPEDRNILKAFLYFTDIDEGTGPFFYVPHSRRGEKYGDVFPLELPYRSKTYRYPEEAELEKRIPPSEWAVCTCRAGTFLFVDTTGFHRGGYATGSDRVVATWAFASQAALDTRRFAVAGDPPPGLSAAARFAVLEGE